MVFCSNGAFCKAIPSFCVILRVSRLCYLPEACERRSTSRSNFASVLLAASARVGFSLARLLGCRAAKTARCPAFCIELSQRVQQVNAEAKHQRVRAAEAQPQSPS